MTVKNNIVKLVAGYVDTDRHTGRFRLRLPFGSSYSIPPLTDAQLTQLASLATRQTRSLQGGDDGIDPTLTFDQVNPQEGDFIFPKFRALDAGLVESYWLDFSGAGVVESSTALFLGQTVYKNHIYWNVENWLGAVSQSVWDPTGDKVSSGKPGVNTELKIDWKSNPKIARGLLMKPPAIHSVSATIDFEWDASHPNLLEQGIFWRNLGQEVEGQIVRIIVTKIKRIYEMSLVYQGANNGSNGQLPDDDEDPEEMSAPQLAATPPPLKLATNKEKHTVKLSTAQKEALGLTAHTGEDVDDAVVIATAESLARRAVSADAIVSAQRAEVLRLATLAEGVGDGDARKLPDVNATLINGADPSQLPGLITMYQEKVDKALPLTCEQGHKATGRRSSVEQADTAPADTAATVKRTNLL